MNSIQYDFVVDCELIEHLVAEYNEFSMFLESYELIGEAEEGDFLEAARDSFDPEELKFIIETEYGRGFIMGQLATLVTIRNANEQAADEDQV